MAAVAICDACDLPIDVGAIRWKCNDCADFDMHDECMSKLANHDASHRWTTNYAAEDQIAQLTEMGGASRELALELLNAHKGDFARALEALLEK